MNINDRIAAAKAETKPRAVGTPAHLRSGPLGKRLAEASMGQGEADARGRLAKFIERALRTR